MRADVEACVASLLADISGADFITEIVIVDNGSDDGLLEWCAATHPQIKTVSTGGNFGFAHGVNAGLKIVNARYYFVLNPDTRFVEPNTLVRLLAWMEQNKTIGVAAPRLVYADGSHQPSAHRFPTLLVQLVRRSPLSRRTFFKKRINNFLLANEKLDTARPVDWAQGSALFIRAEALMEVGPLDERFWMYYEDCDWCRRFWQAGWPIYYLPEITVRHNHGRGSAKVPGIFKPLFVNRLARAHLKSWAQYFWKWRKARLKII